MNTHLYKDLQIPNKRSRRWLSIHSQPTKVTRIYIHYIGWENRAQWKPSGKVIASTNNNPHLHYLLNSVRPEQLTIWPTVSKYPAGALSGYVNRLIAPRAACVKGYTLVRGHKVNL